MDRLEDLRIRPATSEDASALLAIYAPYVRDTAITFEYEVPSREEFSARIERTLERYPYLVAERGNTPVGYAYASPFKSRAAYDWSVETSIYVEKGARRGGVGAMLHAALESSLRAMGIVNMCACITVPAAGEPDDERANRNSMRFHERMGYRLVGEFQKSGYKFERWYDMVWMEKHLGEHLDAVRGGQPPVRPFVEVRAQLAEEGVFHG